jgi:hypothetical protein
MRQRSWKVCRGEQQQLKEEVKQLLEQAEAADAEEDRRHGSQRGDELPEELRRRETGLAKIKLAKMGVAARSIRSAIPACWYGSKGRRPWPQPSTSWKTILQLRCRQNENVDDFCTSGFHGISGAVICAARQRRDQWCSAAHSRAGAESGGNNDRAPSDLPVPVVAD